MPEPPEAQVTLVSGLLRSIDAGDASARERLFEILYDELRGVARLEISKGQAAATIQPTALVNEACLRILGARLPELENRRHFFFVAARAMRDVLLEEARKKQALARGGAWKRQSLDSLEPTLATPAEDLLRLDGALGQLECEDQRQADIVRLRFFAGLNEEQIAETLGVSKRTVSRDWTRARARLALLASPLGGE